jgi:hypothetical protein
MEEGLTIVELMINPMQWDKVIDTIYSNQKVHSKALNPSNREGAKVL